MLFHSNNGQDIIEYMKTSDWPGMWWNYLHETTFPYLDSCQQLFPALLFLESTSLYLLKLYFVLS